MSSRKVHFSLIPKVHITHVWDFAYRQSRKGFWEEAARDRARFRNRIKNLEEVISPVLMAEHRAIIIQKRSF